jgi:hypothetical protein
MLLVRPGQGPAKAEAKTMTEFSAEERAAFIADCNRAAAFYESAPGLAGPRAIVDLYNALARFAALTDPNRPKQLPSRQPEVTP